ncbi:MAG: DUF1501 domain-containing protein [Nevskiales bacterium]
MNRRDLLLARGPAAERLAGRDVLVCVFLRGGADGLSLVPPYADPHYRALRPSLAVGAPGTAGGAIDLDGYFGLHPALAPLEPLYRSGQLAIVQAVGATQVDRSHFSAQSLMERAVNADSSLRTGWLGRHLQLDAGGQRSLRGVAIQSAVDQALLGALDAVAIADGANFALRSRYGAAWISGLEQLSTDGDSFYALAAEATLRTEREFRERGIFTLPPGNGAVYPSSLFGVRMRQAAQYIKSGIGVEAICVNVEGWDTHAGQNPVLARNLRDLAEGLAAFATDLGAGMAEVSLLTMSEFGRRADENASGGTDHGSGNVMLALGGGVRGGRIYGQWPTLAPAMLDAGALAITTDYRSVLLDLLAQRTGNAQAANLFPGFSASALPGLFTAR